MKSTKKQAAKPNAGFYETGDTHSELLKQIELALQEEKLHPYIQEFAGLVSTGKNETVETILNN